MQKISSPASTYRPLRSGWTIGIVLWLTLALVAPGLVHATAGPSLTIVNASPNVYKTQGISVPINFQGSAISSIGFTLDYDQGCLTFDNTTDANNDGTPDAVHFNLPSGFSGSVRFTAANTSGEFKFLIIPPNNITPIPALNPGDIISIDFGVKTTCYTFGTDHPVQFAFSSTSFGSTTGQKVTGATSDGTYTLHFLNHKPAASDVPVSTNEDTAKLITLSSSDADDDAQSFTIVTGPSHGALSAISTPSCTGVFPKSCTATVTYTPSADYNGADSFTYKTNDSLEDGNTATVNITVNAVNDAPSFTKGADQTALEDAGAQSVTGWATSISAGPTNEAGQTLTFNVTNNNNPLFSVQPSVDATGKLTYTPAPNANGSAVVTINLQDDGGTANSGVDKSADQTFNITITPVNDAPSFTKGADQTVLEDASAQSVTGWATSISAGPTDEAGQTLNFVVSNDNNPLFSVQPSVDSTGKLTYTPAPNANGSAVVTVSLHDNGGTANGGADTSATQTFNINVTAVNDTPVGLSLSPKAVNENQPSGTVVGAFSTADNDAGDTFVYSLVAGPGSTDNASFTISGNQLQTAASFNYEVKNSYSIRVRTTDSGNLFAEATFVISINDINDAPVAHDDPNPTLVVVGDGSATATISVLANDNDEDTPAQTLSVVSLGATSVQNGTLTNNTSSVAYKAPTGFTGVDTFTYAAQDSGNPAATSNNATVSVNVVANDARGDCNADSGINAGDFPAIVLEIFDNDPDVAWWKTYLGSFVGSPQGCDANNTKNGTGQTPVDSVDAADISCTVLVYFDGNPPCSAGPLPTAASKTATSTLQIGDSLTAKAGETLNVPITLETSGNRVAAAAFALDFDEAKLHFDAADNDNDGIPDAIHFNTSARFTTIVHYNAELSRVEVAIFGFSVPLPVLDSGVVATVTLQVDAASTTSSAPLHLVKALLGSDQGQAVPLTVVDQDAQITGQVVNKAVYLPLVAHQ